MKNWLSVLAVAAVTILCCLAMIRITGKERKVRIAGTFALISAGGFAYALSEMVQRGLDGGYLFGSIMISLTVPCLIFFVLYRTIKDKRGTAKKKILKERMEWETNQKEDLERQLQEAVSERDSLREQINKQRKRMHANKQAAGEREEEILSDMERIKKEFHEEVESVKRECEADWELMRKESEEEQQRVRKECDEKLALMSREHEAEKERIYKALETEKERLRIQYEEERELLSKEQGTEKE